MTRRNAIKLALPLVAVFLFSLAPFVEKAELQSSERGQNAMRPAGLAPGRRIALVIGNANYSDARLLNPTNDARDIAATLGELGFEVTHRENLSLKEMREAIRAFSKKLRDGEAGLFYFAGHGVQLNGVNYLIPIGAQIEEEHQVQDEALDASTVVNEMIAGGSQLNIIILDACRNNPFARSFRSVRLGLATMQAPRGTGSFIAYSTAPGDIASDGQGRNSPYAQELLRHMRTPGLKLEDVFKQVRAGVWTLTAGKQVTWESSSIVRDFYFKPPAESNELPRERPSASAPPVVTRCRTEVIEASGEAALGNGMTREQADDLAYEDALSNALRQACPMGNASPLVVFNNSLVVNLIQFAKRGLPVNTEILERQTLSDPDERNGERTTVDRRRVRIRTRFVAIAGESDPDFRVTLTGIAPSYVEGQKMIVRVTATKDCYVYLFTVAADQSVTIFFPNRYRRDNVLKAGQSLEFPNADDQGKGIDFVLEVPQGPGAQTKEWVTAIAIKHPVDLLSGTQIQEALEKSYSKSDTGLIDKLLEKLTHLQSSDVAQDVKEYAVIRKVSKGKTPTVASRAALGRTIRIDEN